MKAVFWSAILMFAAVANAAQFGPGTARAQEFAAQRLDMVATIGRHAEFTVSALGRGHIRSEILDAMGGTARHEFVPRNLRGDAYKDRPLPIGYGQTISQPFIVALMTDLLAVGPEHVVLEIGTGSGYQAAVLAPLVAKVHTIEIIPELARLAAARLERLGYANVETRVGDGYYGWEEAAPFDAIMVTAAANRIPPPLIRQIKPGGRMVIPVGPPFALQYLMLVEKTASGTVKTRQLLPVRFVRLTRTR